MSKDGQTICLNMIVKNEAPVIRRCLESLRPLIDHWIIVDTGSTDGTQNIIRDALADIPGELYESSWRDFAYNRTEALELARPHGSYVLIIDADDQLVLSPGFEWPRLQDDSYMLLIEDSGISYQRTQIVRSALPWKWRGVLHEFLTCEDARTSSVLDGLRLRRNHDGARRRDSQTYQRDAALLEGALATETDEFLQSRYRFYLAQSYFDCGNRDRALENYLARAEMGFWDEEVFVSLLRAARIMDELGRPYSEVLETYERASASCPRRAEALHGASALCFRNAQNRIGYEIAKRGLDLPVPADGLFVETWIYEYGLLDEYAINAYWTGAYRDCVSACLRMLLSGKLPAEHRDRVAANAQAALGKLPSEANLGSLGADSFSDQHALRPARELRPQLRTLPRVLIAILAKQKEAYLPLYLQCIENLDYPKSQIVLYVRTNNNKDNTEGILRSWIDRVGHSYADIEFDSSDVDQNVQNFGVHEWNVTRFRVLGHIRNVSLRKTVEKDCDFYFVADVDNFVRSCTLRELVAPALPIVAPLLRSVSPNALYSNFHAEVDVNGYYEHCDQYDWVIQRRVRGFIEMPLVHCTYLIRSDVIDNLTYLDGTDRFEYVVFSDSARKSSVPQYLDNRQVYGYITFEENSNTSRAIFGSDVVGQVDTAQVLLRSVDEVPIRS